MTQPSQNGGQPRTKPLSIDLNSPLFIQCKGQKERFKSRLVGLSPGDYLIVATPRVPGIGNILATNEDILVRYIHRGEVFGFKTYVIGAVTAPFRLTFLAHPASVERINLRKTTRVECYIPTTLTADGRSLAGMILDISTAGCRFSATRQSMGQAPPALETEKVVALSFPVLGHEQRAEMSGMVKNIQQDKNRLSLGILFKDLDEASFKRIEDYIQEVSDFL